MKFRHLTLPTGHLRNPTGPACLVLGSWADWESAYGCASARPRVDFRREVVVAVHMGPCATGGFSVQIRSAETHPGELVISADYRRPGPLDLVTLVATDPRDMVALPRASLAAACPWASGPLRVTVRDSQGDVHVATTTVLRNPEA